MGATHLLTRTLDKVRTEMSLHVLASLQPEANDRDPRGGAADGGDQDLIASLEAAAVGERETQQRRFTNEF